MENLLVVPTVAEILCTLTPLTREKKHKSETDESTVYQLGTTGVESVKRPRV